MAKHFDDGKPQDMSGLKRHKTNLIAGLYEAANWQSQESRAMLHQEIAQAELVMDTIIKKLAAYQRAARDLPVGFDRSDMTHNGRVNGDPQTGSSKTLDYTQASMSNVGAAPEITFDYEFAAGDFQPNANETTFAVARNANSQCTPDISHSGYSAPTWSPVDQSMRSNDSPHEIGSVGNKRPRGPQAENSQSSKRPRMIPEQTGHSADHTDAYSAENAAGSNSDSMNPSRSDPAVPASERKGSQVPPLSRGIAPLPPSGGVAPLRRPLAKPMVASYDWDKVKLDRKRRLSHFGYIEETEAGMLAPKPCWHCSNFTFCSDKSRAKMVCKVYKPETVANYSRAVGNNWRKCSHCWMSGRECSIVEEANRRDPPA